MDYDPAQVARLIGEMRQIVAAGVPGVAIYDGLLDEEGGARRVTLNLAYSADQLEAASMEIERLTNELAEVGSGRFDAEVLAESRRLEASKDTDRLIEGLHDISIDLDSLRQQLEATQRRIEELEATCLSLKRRIPS